MCSHMLRDSLIVWNYELYLIPIGFDLAESYRGGGIFFPFQKFKIQNIKFYIKSCVFLADFIPLWCLKFEIFLSLNIVECSCNSYTCGVDDYKLFFVSPNCLWGKYLHEMQRGYLIISHSNKFDRAQTISRQGSLILKRQKFIVLELDCLILLFLGIALKFYSLYNFFPPLLSLTFLFYGNIRFLLMLSYSGLFFYKE